MEGLDRQALGRALLAAQPWLAATEYGPQAVSAGMCDRCQAQPRLLPVCGPVGYEALCRACAFELGEDAWCEGHLDEGADARGWAKALPDQWGDAVVLFWVATGELRLDPDALPDLSDREVRMLLAPARQEARSRRAAGSP